MRTVLAAASLVAVFAGAPASAQEQSAPLFITATVVSTCRVEVPLSAPASTFAMMPVAVTCARGTVHRVQRPIAPAPHIEVRDALLTIDF
jgi:hypothetical protein